MKNINIENFEDCIYEIVKLFQKASKNEKKVWCEWLTEGVDQLNEEEFFGIKKENDPRNFI